MTAVPGKIAKDRELSEFAEATEVPKDAEPFRQRLRETLWKRLRRQLDPPVRQPGRDADDPPRSD